MKKLPKNAKTMIDKNWVIAYNVREDKVRHSERRSAIMTKEKFVRIHKARGYQVEEFGKMVTISLNGYRATWFFNIDGTVDKDNLPIWHLDRSH